MEEDPCSHGSRFSRLLSDIETATKDVRASLFYAGLVAQWKTDPTITSNLASRRVLDGERMPIVMYGLDSVEHNRLSKLSLSLALALRDHAGGQLPFGAIEVRHPNLDPVELAVVQALGCRIASIEEHCATLRSPEAAGPSLFFMSSSRRGLLGDLLEENWLPALLNRMIVFGESFETVANGIDDKILGGRGDDEPPAVKELSHETERLRYAWAVRTLSQEVKIPTTESSSCSDEIYQQFNNFGWHFLQLSLDDVNMDVLLPSLPDGINRKSWINYLKSMDVEDFREVSRLREDIEQTIDEVRESEFYEDACRQLKEDPSVISELSRRFNFGKHVQMVIYGLGSPTFHYLSQYQFAFALLLKWDAEILNIHEIQIFDPQLTWVDMAVMQSFGCTVLRVDEKCHRRVEKHTLLYTPGLLLSELANLVQANWTTSDQMDKFILLNEVSKIYNPPEYYKDRRGHLWLQLLENHSTAYPVPNRILGLELFERYHWIFLNMDVQGIISETGAAHINVRSWSPADGVWEFLYGRQEKCFSESTKKKPGMHVAATTCFT